MSGWLVAWSRDRSPLNPNFWAESTRAATRYGDALVDRHRGRIALAAWRRGTAEFPISGRVIGEGDTDTAWVGQCVEDRGDATADAVGCVALDRFDAAGVARLNGAFAAAIVRTEPFEVRIVTDRHRHYPVYLHEGRCVTVASTEIRCIVPWLERPSIDRDAVDMLLRCGELIDGQTLLKGIEVLPPGTVVTDSGHELTQRRYWSMRSDGVRAGATTADDLAEALKSSVRRLEAVSPRLGITLSGGLDSRIILDLCERPQRIPSFTWGLPGCRDIVCASQFASLVHSPHVVKHWEPSAFPALWSRGVDLTGGSCGIDSMFMLPFVPLLSSACDVVLNGLAGDVVLGGNWLKRSWLAQTDTQTLGHAVWRWRVPESSDRLVDRLMARTPGVSSAADRWVASIAAHDGARPIERLNDWFVENRIFRTTNCGTMLLRGGVESHSPFFDRDFIDVLTRVDQRQKFKHKLYLEVMNRVAPRAASIKWQRTNVSPSRGYYANLAAMAFQRVATQVSAPFGYAPFRDLQVADVGGWLRGPWRQAVDGVIRSESLLQRGLVDPDVALETWRAHVGGADHSRQISVLIAVELFARLVMDGDAA